VTTIQPTSADDTGATIGLILVLLIAAAAIIVTYLVRRSSGRHT
jgi:hypothetical protein